MITIHLQGIHHPPTIDEINAESERLKCPPGFYYHGLPTLQRKLSKDTVQSDGIFEESLKIFQGVYGMSAGVSGLPELGPVLGCVITGVFMVFFRQKAYIRKLEANNNVAIS